MAGVFTQIKEIYGYLVGEQRAVADFLQRCPELATQAGNQAELAELIGVEERNVLILIQSMGYLNFEQFQQELMITCSGGDSRSGKERSRRCLDRCLEMRCKIWIEARK